jgi:hypothetical protein
VILLRPGKFSDVTSDNVGPLKSPIDAEAPDDAKHAQPEEGQLAVEKDVQQRKELGAEEMGKMRHEVSVKLQLVESDLSTPVLD